MPPIDCLLTLSVRWPFLSSGFLRTGWQSFMKDPETEEKRDGTVCLTWQIVQVHVEVPSSVCGNSPASGTVSQSWQQPRVGGHLGVHEDSTSELKGGSCTETRLSWIRDSSRTCARASALHRYVIREVICHPQLILAIWLIMCQKNRHTDCFISTMIKRDDYLNSLRS